ncbi:MAG: HNH endonuclease [Lachnoclostridium sp.]|jgi:N6-L-threonylcarbamoyladenine synthase|nr:HNH endonuclease [Lachnoclostridium sp.]
MVYVLNIKGNPIMPCKEAKARKLLRDKRAKVIQRTPFVVQLNFECENITQDIILGIDAGSKTVGVSATTGKKELYSAEATLRNNIVELLSGKRQYRRTRRNRLRYRKPRFNNRKKDKGWLAPSVQHKIDSHLKLVKGVHNILPISKIIVEVAAFDIQKIKNPDISSKEYQQGKQLDFWNVREYVLFRDGHKCQGKKGCANKILNVHHIETRKTGGDSPGNLITLCENCHTDYHSGKLKLNLKRGHSFKDAAFMGIMRWMFYNRLRDIYSNVSMTYGYITKNNRIKNGIEKTHAVDAYCIAGNLGAKRSDIVYTQKFVRKNNRSLHKANLLKGGRRKANKAPYLVHGYKLFDKVLAEGKEWFVFGRRSSGYFDLRNLDGGKLNKGSYNCKKIKLLEITKTLLTERRMAIPPPT